MARIKNFRVIFNKWLDIDAQLRKESLEYITKTLKKAPRKEIIFDTDNHNQYFSVTYDGGNHPEYDANPYSVVQRVYIKGKQIYLETEDAVDYSIDNLNAEEMFNVAHAIEWHVAEEWE